VILPFTKSSHLQLYVFVLVSMFHDEFLLLMLLLQKSLLFLLSHFINGIVYMYPSHSTHHPIAILDNYSSYNNSINFNLVLMKLFYSVVAIIFILVIFY